MSAARWVAPVAVMVLACSESQSPGAGAEPIAEAKPEKTPRAATPGRHSSAKSTPGAGRVRAVPARGGHPARPAPAPRTPPVRVPPESELAGPRAGTLDDPKDQALSHFFRSLAATAGGGAGQLTRITHWGSSVIGADGLTGVVRSRLQRLYGDGGEGWVNAAPGSKWYLPRHVRHRAAGWRSRTVVNGRSADGCYGLGGVLGLGSTKATVRWEAGADALELYYQALPGGGQLAVRVDGGPEQLVETRSDEPGDAWATFRAPGAPGRHRWEVTARGAVRLYGATLERPDRAGVVYDVIPLVGARGERLLNFDPEHLKRQVAHRRPDLIVAMFGGNELAERRMNLQYYESRYRLALERLRAGRPEASCLVMSPQDHGTRVEGRVVSDPLLRRIVEIQRRIARDSGCAFFDSIAAMGGPGAVSRGLRSKPPLYYADLTHLTAAGDEELGLQLYEALMAAFVRWLGGPGGAGASPGPTPRP